MTRTSLARILNALLTTPKFDIFVDIYSCNRGFPQIEVLTEGQASIDDCGDVIVTTPLSDDKPCLQYVPYSISVIAGMPDAPVDGTSIYQTDRLKGALNLSFLVLNDTYWTQIAGDFTFNSDEGVIDISPNKFYTGDTLVGNYFKLV
jgi:hypothetical protein